MLQALPDSKWNFGAAAHLLNRAGFGGTSSEVEALCKLGRQGAVAHLVEIEKIPEEVTKPSAAESDPNRASKLIALRDASDLARREMIQERFREHRRQTLELQAWWLERMVSTSRPLQEKLALFWHGHFATSIQKVRDPHLMWKQNEMFRQFGSGLWLDLLDRVTRDPAMLIWLDQAKSRLEHPNENYARELFELFALGEGHFSEQDVLESARALTGITVDRITQESVYQLRLHDSGVKTIFGKTGRFGGKDLLRILSENPQSARFICTKLWTFFAAENPSPNLVDALASVFQQNGGQFKPVLRIMFESEEFYSPTVVRRQIKSPVQLLVSATKQLERPLPPKLVLVNVLRLLGQELFRPPNVKGWDGGTAWINTNTLLNRHRLASMLVDGKFHIPGTRTSLVKLPPIRLSSAFGDASLDDPEALVAGLERRLIQARFNEKERASLVDYLKNQRQIGENELLTVLRLAMCTAEYQLA